MSRHRHQWAEVGRVFVKPAMRSMEGRLPNEMWERVLFGVTSVEMRCECGDVTECQLTGDHTMTPRA